MNPGSKQLVAVVLARSAAALLGVTGWAVLHPRPEPLRLTGAAWLTFGVPHLASHLRRLDMDAATDKAGNVVTLGGTVILALALLIPPQGRDRGTNDIGGTT